MYKRPLYLLSLFALLLAACHGNQPTNSTTDSTYIYSDDYGARIVVPTYPRHIVSTSPAVTEIICDLGACDRLIGRTDYCVYPPEVVERVESIGGISNLNIEKILSLKPDLVISGSMIPKGSVKSINSQGVPMVCVIEQPSFDSLFSNIRKIGKLIGIPQRADSLCQVLHIRLDKVKRQLDTNIDESQRPKVYYCVGFGKGGNFTAGGNTFINDIVRMAGGRNIAEGIQGWSISMEAIFDADPDYIIIRKEDKEAFEKTAPYTRLRAVKHKHVIPIESGMMDLQAPRNIDAVELLSHTLKKE